jgi:hypothetical protein
MKVKSNKMKNDFLTIRHFHDENALRTHGSNGPLKANQEDLIDKTAHEISSELLNTKKQKVRFLYTKKTRRIEETAKLISEKLINNGIEVVFQHETRLEVMDQGELNLPEDYQDGEWFTPLDIAWDVICDEAYGKKNIFYRFGDDLNGKYPVLTESFIKRGQSIGSSLIKKYSFIYDLIHNKFFKEDELLIIVSQSDLPFLIMELQILSKETGVDSKNLPYKCWEVYKASLQDKMYDKKAVGDGNFDIPMGYIGKFDLSDFVKNGFDKIIKNAGVLLAGERN